MPLVHVFLLGGLLLHVPVLNGLLYGLFKLRRVMPSGVFFVAFPGLPWSLYRPSCALWWVDGKRVAGYGVTWVMAGKASFFTIAHASCSHIT